MHDKELKREKELKINVGAIHHETMKHYARTRNAKKGESVTVRPNEKQIKQSRKGSQREEHKSNSEEDTTRMRRQENAPNQQARHGQQPRARSQNHHPTSQTETLPKGPPNTTSDQKADNRQAKPPQKTRPPQKPQRHQRPRTARTARQK